MSSFSSSTSKLEQKLPSDGKDPQREPSCRHCSNLSSHLLDKNVHKSFNADEDTPELSFQPYQNFKETSDSGCKYCSLICKAAEVQPFPALASATSIQVTFHHDRTTLWQTFIKSGGPTGPRYKTLPRATPLSESTSSEEVFEFLRSQLFLCEKNHKECLKTSESKAPKRLLNVGSLDGNIQLQLSDAKSRKRYAALSYCWGGKQTLKLTKETELSFQEPIRWEDIPPLLQDAITFCRRLDIPFLWIDALCILQDQGCNSEWGQEAAHMADVYQNATVTIYAACCSNPQQSFLSLEGSTLRKVHILETCAKTGEPKVVARVSRLRGFHTSQHLKRVLDPLEKRAWAFQEYEMSRRLIAYTSNEIQWRCRNISTCEPGCIESLPKASLKYRDPIPHLARRLEESSVIKIFAQWQVMIEKYTLTSVSFSEDKLVALAGLASIYGMRLNSRYLAGLWKENLVLDLLWIRDNVVYWTKSQHNSDTYRAPSFSWASIDRPVRYIHIKIDHQVIEFEKEDYKTVSEDLYGQISGALLHIRSQLIPATLILTGKKPNYQLASVGLVVLLHWKKAVSGY
ncbi:HET-domain-containing protein [Byssothecium circinans]|uniref:HET-domain-containing protein n=1 Tax=Byssothecium circinans TaxID=147558 RepID=A0A6A5TX77_9PLEO|nr:HET-domain-containing protein [Byssothecium circinans]